MSANNLGAKTDVPARLRGRVALHPNPVDISTLIHPRDRRNPAQVFFPALAVRSREGVDPLNR